MSKLRPLAVLALAFLCGLAGAVGFGLLANGATPSSRSAQSNLTVQVLSDSLYVAAQIAPDDVDAAVSQGIRTVIDLRPDGEAEGQPNSDLIRTRAEERGMAFAYVPVPHGEVPDAVVDRLAETLLRSPGPILLYCRSGRRAARTWALAEAGRSGGLPVERIEAQVVAAGQPIEDLAARLRARSAGRSASRSASQ